MKKVCNIEIWIGNSYSRFNCTRIHTTENRKDLLIETSCYKDERIPGGQIINGYGRIPISAIVRINFNDKWKTASNIIIVVDPTKL